jgi:MSHA biogenesis protein MshQ
MIKFILVCFLMVTSINSFAYWSCAWPFRTALNIQENSASNLTDYQVKITITGSDLNNAYDWTNNGFDLRVIDSDDESLVDFWLEDWDQVAKTATIWVRLDTLSANENRQLYIYYGNEFADQLANIPLTFVDPGIQFHTRRVFSNPVDLTDARNLFDTAGDGNAGYGCDFITDFTGVTNANQFGQNGDFIAISSTYFNVASNETGIWGIRYGADFGGGGGLYVDGIPLEEQWGDDLWWANDWDASGEVLQGTIDLTAGYHQLEVIGQEGCCDGGITVQFQRPGGVFTAYNVGDIDIRSRACPISSEPSFSFGAQATASCPPPFAQYRMDDGPWGGTADVLDQTGNFPGTMVGSVLNQPNTQVCNGLRVNDNNTVNQISGLNTGVDLDADIGAVGTVAFWIKTVDDWNAGNLRRTLMDASLFINGSASDRYFFLEKRGDGQLLFRFEDSADGDYAVLESAATSRVKDVWYHITMTWDFPNDQFNIYQGDSLIASGTPNTNGAVSLLGDLHFGDNSSEYNVASGNSSNAFFDEITIYNTVISVSEIRGLMAITRSCAISNTKACGDVFPDGLVAINDGNIDFGFDAQLLNNPDTQLSAATVSMNGAANQYTCGATDVCTAGDPVVPFVSAGPFQSRTSTLDVNVGFRDTETVGITSNEYRTINTSSRSTLNFSESTYTEFFINTLSIGERNTVNLAPGTYWINNLSVGNRSTFNVLNDGPVRLYINNVSSLSSRLTINSPSEGVAGTPENLLIYFYDTTVSLLSRTTITGTVYAEGDITFSSDVNMFGLLAANNINLGSNSQVTYLESSYDGLSDIAWCASSSSPSIGSITISAALTGINCLPSEIDISIFDTNGDPLLDYDQTLNLSTDVMHADWSVDVTAQNSINNGSADDGAATYPMSADDLGGIKLFLKNTHPEITTITVEAEGVSQTATIDFQSAGFAFSNIPTQISAQTSATLSIQAVETDQVTGACQTLLLNNQTVEMAVECISPNSCGAASNQVNSTPVSTNGSGMVNSFSDVTLNFGDASSSTANFTNTYNDAGTLRLWARYQLLDSSGAATGNVIQGSSNVFVNRPAGFCIESPDVNWQCSAPALNAGCSAFKQAGDNFNLLVTAKQANGASTDYCSHGTTNNFTNSVDLSHNLISPTAIDGGEAGTFSLTSINLTSGTGNSAANFSEMGVFTITAGGNTYFTETLPTNSSVNIGRFYPKEFQIVSTTSAIYNDGYSNLVGSGFTYTGQLEADGTGSISYDTEPTFTFEVRGFNDQKLNNFITPLYSTPVSTISASSNTPDSNTVAMTVTAGYTAGVITGPNASDQFTYTFSSADHFVFDRTQASLIPPFINDIQLSVDSLSVALDSINLASAATISGSGGTMYYGRIRIENAYGPETSPVPQLFKAERFDGTQFVLNSLDNGTAYDLNGVNSIVVTDVGNLTNNLTATDSSIVGDLGATGQFTSGLINTSWSVPANNRYGSYEFLYTVDDWLKYDWDNSADGINEDPTGIVNFGQFRGNDSIIYWKEIYY